MKQKMKITIYLFLMAIISLNTSCKDDESKDNSKKVDDDKSYYEFTPQDGELAGKTFKVLDIAQIQTGSIWKDEQVLQSDITFHEARGATTYFRIRWNGDSPYPIGSEEMSIDNEEGFIRLTCKEGEQVYQFISEKGTFTVTDKKTVQLEDKIGQTTYPAYELEGTFEGTFVSLPTTEKVNIKGNLKLVNVVI